MQHPRQKWGYVALGFLLALVFSQTILPAAAALVARTIQVHTGVTIYVDDVKLEPTDVNGDPVEALLYNGTTYLPVRAISQAVGKEVYWEGSTHTAYLGRHAGPTLESRLATLTAWRQAIDDLAAPTVNLGYDAIPASGTYLFHLGDAAQAVVEGGQIRQVTEYAPFDPDLDGYAPGACDRHFYFREGAVFCILLSHVTAGTETQLYYENGALLGWIDPDGARHTEQTSPLARQYAALTDDAATAFTSADRYRDNF